MKRTAADHWFSLCTRERADWTCEMCGTVYANGRATGKAQGLDCSHYIGRGNYSVRYSVINSFAHCVSCHYKFSGDASLQVQEYEKVFGAGAHKILMEMKNDIETGRQLRREQKLISAHYRAEYRRMRKLREAGRTGRLEFMGY